MNQFAQHDNRSFAAQAVAKSRSGRNTWMLAAGAALALSALFVRQRTRAAENQHPPAGKFVEVDGVRLHYVERGEGQPVVLLHGDGSMIQDFELSGVIDLAAQKYRVIVFDRPGYGYSDRPRTTIWTPQAQAALLRRALLQIGAENPIVVGHSWGTLVAVSMALEYQDFVKSLVLLSGYYYPTVRADVALLSPPAIPIIGDLMRYTISPLIGRAIWPLMKRRIFGPAATPQRFEKEFPVWMVLRPSHLRATAAESAMLIPAAFSLRHRYHELTMPVVIMTGDSDKYLNAHTHSENLHRELPHSSFHITHGAGHMVHHMAPQDVLNAIDQAASALPAELRRETVSRTEGAHVFPAASPIH